MSSKAARLHSAALRQDLSDRRRALMEHLGDGGIGIVVAAKVQRRNGGVPHPYRQDSDFYYLTGFQEPDAVAVLIPGRASAEYIVFCRDRDAHVEAIDGERLGVDAAVPALGCDDAFPIGDIDDIMPGLLEGRERLYYNMGRDLETDQRVMGWLNRARSRIYDGERSDTAPHEVASLDVHLHELRIIKSAYELDCHRRAAQISVAAHRRLMQCSPEAEFEYELDAELIYTFRRQGAVHAYPPIVGAGARACIGHYTANNQRLGEHDLVVVDAGCEVECYASDLSRSFPARGTFTDAQRAVYQWVLRASDAALEAIRPGATWMAPQRAVERVLTEGLIALGLLRGDLERLLEQGAHRRFAPHRLGHWLGLDTHDVGGYRVDGEEREFLPGMLLTVEPGLYLPRSLVGNSPYADIGVRIEDNVIVTPEGIEVTTRACPREIDQIETLMAGLAAPTHS